MIYDVTVLAANGFSIEGPRACTLLAHHAAFPGCAHRLQVVTSQFFATPPWKADFRNNEETPERLTIYNGIDTAAARALSPKLELIVKQTKTEKIYALDLKMAEIASKMHLVGMLVSREVNSDLLATFSKNVAEARREVESVAADPKIRENLWHYLALAQAQKRRKTDELDLEARYQQRLEEIKIKASIGKAKWKINAPKHVAALIQALGTPLVQVTETGQVSTKKDILEALAAKAPVVRDILAFRENDKLLSTFIWQVFDRFDNLGELIQYGYADTNDRIHPIWVVHKITGRWASSEPVVSNVPKEKWKKMPDGTKVMVRPNLRRQIVAPPGRVLIGFDFGQLEYRVIALISGDDFLCRVFAEGKDIHRECARVVFSGFDQLDPTLQKKARDEGKNFSYGALYGGSPETLHETLLKQGYNYELADVAKSHALLLARMPGVVAWQRNCVQTASRPPYEIREFLYGRRRTFPMGQVEATESMNFGVQAAGASIMNTGMERMDQALDAYKEAFAIVQVHDAAVFECWEDDAPKLAEDVKRCFTQEYERDGRVIPFPIDCKVAQTWADV
jgi:DNA polymerase I-like protein with 3'-5' exonuclease and polymerase domains